MRSDKSELSGLRPVKNYTPPELPTLQAARGNPAPLKKLPSRWQSNAKVIACIGLMGAVTLSSCTPERMHHGGAAMPPIYVTQPTEQETTYPEPEPSFPEPQSEYPIPSAYVSLEELNLRLHGGGAGSVSYVVHFTEQEAFGIVRAQLEAAGLSFGATPPGYTVENWGDIPDFGLDLFDEGRNVAVSHISWEGNNQSFGSRGGSRLAERVAEEFAEQTSDTNIGVFYNPGVWVGQLFPDQEGVWGGLRGLPEPSEERIIEAKTAARPVLEENLAAQVQEFIAFLRAEGILE